jgi:hypothetical protein
VIVEDICKKLRPIHGRKIDRLWQAYSIENTDGKRDIEQMLQILYTKTFPGGVLQDYSGLYPPPEKSVQGEYPIGTVTYADRDLFQFGLREDDWIKHMLIVGASGSGKTNLCFQIMKTFLQKNKPFLVLDWKRNYRDIIHEDYSRNVRVFTVGRDIAPFRFNPLIPPPGTSATTWLKKLIEVIAHATFVGEGVMYLLQKGLDNLYREFGMYDTEPVKRYPTLRDLLDTINGMEAKGREAGWMSSTLRALGALTFGETGKIFNIHQQPNIGELLEQPVILEMDSLTNSDKTFLVEGLLLWIHHYRLSSPKGKREQFDHSIILEEAHHVIGKEKSDLVGGEAITDVIIREIRELGESVIIIDQCPSLLSLPARANTWCSIILNLKDAKDVNSAASALLMEAADKKILGRLDTGQAVVKLQGRWNRPFTIDIPLVQIRKGSVSDTILREKMSPYSTYFSTDHDEMVDQKDIPENRDPRKKKVEISSEEMKLVDDIKQHPYSGVVERYKRIEWSRRKGNEQKKTLHEKGILDTEEIPTRSGRIVILKLTKSALETYGKPQNKNEHETRQGGVTHEYWKNKYAEIYRDKGYEVILEYPVGGGKTIDIAVEKDGHSIAVEIETGRSDIPANLMKCLKSDINELIFVATNRIAQKKILEVIQNTPQKKKKISVQKV